jgi:hypothetical protein
MLLQDSAQRRQASTLASMPPTRSQSFAQRAQISAQAHRKRRTSRLRDWTMPSHRRAVTTLAAHTSTHRYNRTPKEKRTYNA